MYSKPEAFTASMMWHRCSGNPGYGLCPGKTTGTIEAACHANHDPMAGTRSDFPHSVSDRLDDFFVDYKLERLPGVGHFTPLEATDKFAAAIKARIKD